MTVSNVNLRRHRSLDSTSSTKSRTRALLLHRRHERHSPYLGSFRHAPSRNLNSNIIQKAIDSIRCDMNHLQEHGNHLAYTKHRFPYRMCCQQYAAYPTKYTYQKSIDHFVLVTDPDQLTIVDILSGHLRGGAEQGWHHSATSASSATATGTTLPQSLLSSLRQWLLGEDKDTRDYYNEKHEDSEPHSYDVRSRSCQHGTNTETDTVVDEYDNYDTVTGSALRARDDTLSVSSLAEAYYNRHANKELYCYETIEDRHRINYVITQMDILRMSRNASRHLDVASILLLPTITYAAKHQQPTEKDTGFSWRLVDHEGQDHQESTQEDEDVCVICLEHFSAGDTLRVLPCNHSFHTGCIDRWLSGSHSFLECDTTGCPTCKNTVQQYVHPPAWAFSNIGSALHEEGSTRISDE